MKNNINPYFIVSMLIMSFSLQAAPSLDDSIPEIDCLLEPNITIELSSPVAGVLDKVLVDRSDRIRKGQIVAVLKSDVEKVLVRISEEKVNLSKVESERAVELYTDSVITLSEKELTDHELKINELELERSKAILEQRRIRSPISAVVADRYLMPGEYVDDNPVLKIAQLDPLRVEIITSVDFFGKIKKGMHAHVTTELESINNNLIAKVVLVDKVIDAASGTFGVRLVLRNKRNKIPGGLKCKVRFFTSEEESQYKKK